MDNKDLLNRFAVASKNDGLPPLAGKIMGLFYMSDQKYFSFEEIVNELGSSRGAVSKTLNLLIRLQRISFNRKESNRKRHFYLDIRGTEQFMRSLYENYHTQNQLLKECLQIRTDQNLELNNFIENSLRFNKDMLIFLEKKIEQYF